MGLNVSVDTNVFVGVINKEPDSAPSRKILDGIDSGSLRCAVSTVVVAEVCAGYHTAGQVDEKDDFLAHLRSSQNYDIVELSMGIADEAGRIKAETGLKLPDAIIVASALKGGSECLITNDDTLRRAGRFVRVVSAREFVDGK